MASTLNLFIDQGTDFSTVLVVNDETGSARNLTGYTGRGKLKRGYTSTTNTSFTVDINNPSNGEVVISLTNTQTSNLRYGRYVYDVEIENNGIVERIMQGLLIIDPEVTR